VPVAGNCDKNISDRARTGCLAVLDCAAASPHYICYYVQHRRVRTVHYRESSACSTGDSVYVVKAVTRLHSSVFAGAHI
jgi:hypothetical protein